MAGLANVLAITQNSIFAVSADSPCSSSSPLFFFATMVDHQMRVCVMAVTAGTIDIH
jgi:hypothetical protein